MPRLDARAERLQTASEQDRAQEMVSMLLSLPPDVRESFLVSLTPAEAEVMRSMVEHAQTTTESPLVPFTRLPHQEPPGQPTPDHTPPWRTFMLTGGRGIGKTDALTRYGAEHAYSKPCYPNVPGGHRMIAVSPTQGDAVEAVVTGPSGLLAHDPKAVLRTTRGGTFVVMGNGVDVRIVGANTPEDVERLRAAGNRCCALVDELASWRQVEAMHHLRIGLRLGPAPRMVIATTPKPREPFKSIYKQGSDPNNTRVVMTHATTDDNPYLDEEYRAELYDMYGGTRLGQQELLGHLLEDTPGALWTQEMIERAQYHDLLHSEATRIVVGVDPSGTRTSTDATTGIVAVGLLPDCPCGSDAPLPHLAVYADGSVPQPTPTQWAKKVVEVYHTLDADRVVAERNFGGDMVEHTLRTVEGGQELPIEEITSSRGKRVRAEPFAAMYEQGRVHHSPIEGYDLADLEEQMLSWDASDSRATSPDRLDAAVFAAAELLPRMKRGQVRLTRPPAYMPSMGQGRMIDVLGRVR